MLNEIVVGIIVLLTGMLVGGLIQWARSETPAAMQARDIADLNKSVGELKQICAQQAANFEKFAGSFRPRVQHIEEHLKLKDQIDQTGKFPAFTGVRPSGESEIIK